MWTEQDWMDRIGPMWFEYEQSELNGANGTTWKIYSATKIQNQ